MYMPPYTVKVVEHVHVSPPPNSIPSTSIPLTFFDIPWLLCRPMERIFFYEFPFPTLHFIDTILPIFNESLSLTLQHFFPLVGNLVCPPNPTKPYILYDKGDSVHLIISEANADFDFDFSSLLSDYPQDVRVFHPLVPHLPSPYSSSSDTNAEFFPLLALQVTIFPNSGICIGITFRHVVADGMAFHSFMKSWASIFRSKQGITSFQESLPCHNKDVIKDLNGLEAIYLNQWWSWRSFWKEDTNTTNTTLEDKVRATFTIKKRDIERAKQWISMKNKNTNDDDDDHDDSKPLNMSTFVVTCAFIWVCLVKSQESTFESNIDIVDNFCFVANCRNRFDIKAPTNYFGNCLAICYVSVERKDLVGENGVFVAAKAIANEVRKLENGVLGGAKRWLLDWKDVSEKGNLVVVAGSPKLRVYETDFGWGKLKKTEVIHIDESGSISLAESRDEEGGIEVGLALGRIQMEAFVSLFEQGMKGGGILY